MTFDSPTLSPGTSRLAFARNGDNTVITRVLARSPAKLIATRGRGTTSWVYAATLGGGFVGGDQLDTTIEVGPGARALLTTQASTKVYGSPRRSTQRITAEIGDDALLAVVPDPVVCYASADFSSVQRYTLADSASLVMVDWITSGRHASGERWAFSRYESRFDISRGGSPVFFDGVVLSPGLDPIAARMSRFDVLLTAVVTGPLTAAAGNAMLADIASQPIVANSNCVVSASRLRDTGVLVRIAGSGVEAVGLALRRLLSFVSPLVGDDLWSRKW